MIHRVDLSAPPSRITVMLSGLSRSGKTECLATFPRMMVLADETEHGYTTIQHMDPSKFYEPDRPPEVFAISTWSGLEEMTVQLESMLHADPFAFASIGIDSLTFFVDMLLAEMMADPATPRGRDGEVDNRRLYQKLGVKVQAVAMRLHKLPVNIVWATLVKEPEAGQPGGIAVAGQSRIREPARCDIWAYMEQVSRGKNSKPDFRMNLQDGSEKEGGYKAGHRFGPLLPSTVLNPTYKMLEEMLALQPWLERLAQYEEKKNTKPAKIAAAK